jgi:ABC-type multidrug transport system fused ATPase/permease subunit
VAADARTVGGLAAARAAAAAEAAAAAARSPGVGAVLHRLRLRYPNGVVAVRDVSLTVRAPWATLKGCAHAPTSACLRRLASFRSKALARQVPAHATRRSAGLHSPLTPLRPVLPPLSPADQLRAGELTCLLGHNGAGKSSTIGLVTGLLAPSSGDCWVSAVPLCAVLLVRALKCGRDCVDARRCVSCPSAFA